MLGLWALLGRSKERVQRSRNQPAAGIPDPSPAVAAAETRPAEPMRKKIRGVSHEESDIRHDLRLA